MKINIALLEDEDIDRKTTLEMIDRFFKEMQVDYSVTRFDSAESFLSCPNGYNDFQLLLMDIILPGNKNGMDLAREVRKVNRDVAIMFITKTVQFAINGYEVNAVDYILKPLVYDEFSLKLKKAVRYSLLHTEHYIVLNHKSGKIRLAESEVYYVEVKLHYLNFITKKGDFTIRGTMKEVEAEFSKAFCHSTNSYLINLRYVEAFEGNNVIVNGVSLPIAKPRKTELIRAFNAYTGAN